MPHKCSALKTLRAQTAARQKLTHVKPIGSQGDSAYESLKKGNRAQRYGKRVRDEDDEREDQEAVPEPPKKKAKAVKKRPQPAKPKKVTKPKPPQESKTLVEQHGQMEELTTTELVHGGESVTDVFVKFGSDLAAEVVKVGINGEMVEGRKLQVKYWQLPDCLTGS